MILSVVERWSPNPDVETSFNPCTRRVTYRNRNYLYTQNSDDYSCRPYLDLQHFRYFPPSHGLIGLCFTAAEDFAAMHRTERLVEVVRMQDLASTELKLGKRNRVLGYHWVEAALWDLVLLHTGGVICLRLEKDSVRLVTVRKVSVQMGVYWLEPRSGWVVAGKDKPGDMATFYIHEKTTAKMLEGPSFSLHLPNSTPAKWTNGHSLPALPLPRTETHCCALGKLYEYVYFTHFSQVEGTIRLYRLEKEAVSLSFGPITLIGKTQCSIRMLDSLLVIQCHSSQEEFIYDIKTPWCQSRPFCTVTHTSTVLSGNSYQSSHPLLTDLLCLDHDVYLDPAQGYCYKAHLLPLDIVQHLRNPLDGVLFLMRRLGGKYDSFALLRKCWAASVEIETLPAFLEALGVVYYETACESSASFKAALDHLQKALLESTETEEIERKMAKERAAIRASYQKEMCELVLTSLMKDQSLSGQLVTAVLMEFLRSLLEAGIEPSLEAEKLLAEHLVAHRDFTLLQDCIEYQVLRPNSGLCQLLEGELLYDQIAALEQWAVLSSLCFEADCQYEGEICAERSRQEVVLRRVQST